ncbi:MAG: hypothetical protein AVDCRST_MAG19-2121 [uncultured Thermomicrobiales bacterium]|uniref:Uncharacterized protein n=1 Tax=uncultured Thermomicrobiales bacterium TaxID=1645740 RepID=A0A6J4V0L6_9BACT|nr:MAG: hypothetical protein AVDCRST_MAG19-2121 [uncultured Thermomicrobiales bacterium]
MDDMMVPFFCSRPKSALCPAALDGRSAGFEIDIGPVAREGARPLLVEESQWPRAGYFANVCSSSASIIGLI